MTVNLGSGKVRSWIIIMQVEIQTTGTEVISKVYTQPKTDTS